MLEDGFFRDVDVASLRKKTMRKLISRTIISGEELPFLSWDKDDNGNPLLLKEAEINIFIPASSLAVGDNAWVTLQVNGIESDYKGIASESYVSATIGAARSLYGVMTCALKTIGSALLMNAFYLSSDGASRPTSYRPTVLLSGVSQITEIKLMIGTLTYFPVGSVIEVNGRRS